MDALFTGFGIKSTAPSSIALNTLSESAFELITMVGVGFVLMRILRNVKPSMRGISRSSVTTSGARSFSFFRPSSPSVAVPITLMVRFDSSIVFNERRLNAESSIIRTLI